MTVHVPELWGLEAHHRVELEDLASMCSLSAAELRELVDYGALVPLLGESGDAGLQFSAACVPPLREAMRLRTHYDLDLFTVSLLLGYLQRIAHLEQQVRALQANLPHPSLLPREGPTPWREPHA
ncbi:MAG TPA: chaperone modulator CbpM [Ramlibacter sp.]|uniref:chaperone modulator CbpM n=1 Tax=Ramlibacter sp. TaxID=1917967 RepID=UPI002ED44235